MKKLNKNQTYFRILLSLAFLLSITPAFSQKWKDWGGDYCSNYQEKIGEGDGETISYVFNAETKEAYVDNITPHTVKNIVIPASVEVDFHDPNNDYQIRKVDCKVIGIGTNACRSTGITSLSLPGTVEYIGDGAFSTCKDLEVINGCHATEIGRLAFAATGISLVNFLDYTEILGDGCFQNCKNLTWAILPGMIQSVGEGIFYGCESLSQVTINEGVPAISKNMFRECASLESIEIPSSITSIAESAFMDSGLKSIDIPYTVTSYSNKALWSCKQLESVSINVISLGAFPYSSLCPVKKLVLGDLMETMKTNYGYDIRDLKELTIGRSMKEISGYGISDIYSNAIDVVTCRALEPPVIADKCFNSQTYNNAKLYVPSQSLEKYRAATGWKNFKYIQVDTDDVQSIEIEENRTDNIYDLNGHQLDKPQKGINIIGGRKILIQ